MGGLGLKVMVIAPGAGVDLGHTIGFGSGTRRRCTSNQRLRLVRQFAKAVDDFFQQGVDLVVVLAVASFL
jgi:hypothetical protein